MTVTLKQKINSSQSYSRVCIKLDDGFAINCRSNHMYIYPVKVIRL